MKYFRCHNTKLQEEEGWKTHDKKGQTIIYDENNNYAFIIDFGPVPKISVWKNSDRHNLGEMVFERRFPTRLNKQDVKNSFEQYLSDLTNLGK